MHDFWDNQQNMCKYFLSFFFIKQQNMQRLFVFVVIVDLTWFSVEYHTLAFILYLVTTIHSLNQDLKFLGMTTEDFTLFWYKCSVSYSAWCMENWHECSSIYRVVKTVRWMMQIDESIIGTSTNLEKCYYFWSNFSSVVCWE